MIQGFLGIRVPGLHFRMLLREDCAQAHGSEVLRVRFFGLPSVGTLRFAVAQAGLKPYPASFFAPTAFLF